MERRRLSYGRQTVEQDDIEAVVEVLGSETLTQGPRVEEFEEAVCSYTGASYALCCSSGTAALHLACLAAGLGAGDEVITSPNTFIATANCALYVGATPRFADIDPETFNISPAEIEKRIECADGRTRALIPVHYAGLPCDMDAITWLARKHGLMVIEDACHALGASRRSTDGVVHRIGSSACSEMTVFSFHPVKSITTGEGGAVTTNDRTLYERLKTLRAHGVVRDPAVREASPWLYEVRTLGYNYRLSEIHCALGISQLKKLERFIRRRAQIADIYNEAFAGQGHMKTPPSIDGLASAHHLYPLRIDFSALGIDKGRWFAAMSAAGVNLQVHYIPVHLQPFYAKKFSCRPGDFPNAERFYAQEVSLPIYPGLDDDEVSYVADTILSTLRSASSGTSAGMV